METAQIIEFQKKQESKYLCSACGADRGCKCNAPAVEKLAAVQEKNRAESRERMRRKRERDQRLVTRNTAEIADPIEEPCHDCDTPQDFWQRSLSNMAGDAIAMRAYWTRQFGNWQSFEISTSLITLAEQAAGEWSALANLLRRGK